MKWLKSKTLWAAVVLIAIAAGTTHFVLKRRAARPPVQWETTAVDRGRIVARVTATGILSALVTVQVGSQVSGSIQKLYADFNSPVKKGQIIAKIDPRLFQASLENARANYAQAKATLMKDEVQARFAERQSKRQGALVKDKLIAPADFDTAESAAGTSLAQVEADKANVQQARAILHQAEVNLALTNIISPTDGVVISRNVDVGQTVAASLSAPIIFVIAEDLRKMQVDTSVAEADVGKLTAGMDATFVVDAYPGERFKGKVRQIRNAAQTLQNVVTYDAVIDVDNSELKLRPGMTANVNFVFANRDRRPAHAQCGPALSSEPRCSPRSSSSHPSARAGRRCGRWQSPRRAAGKASGGMGSRQHAARAAEPPAGTDDTPDRKAVWVLRAACPARFASRPAPPTAARPKWSRARWRKAIRSSPMPRSPKPPSRPAPALPGLLPAGGRRPF
jgi:HlyD family secretion protein